MNGVACLQENECLMKPDVNKPAAALSSELSPSAGLSPRKTTPEMDKLQFMQWAALLEARTGMSLPENRISFLATNLGHRMRELGINSYQKYYELVQNGVGATVEWNQLIHHLTVHETRFIRHEESLSLICEHVLPQDNRFHRNKPLTTNVWSVGCSTGQEPYSIAMAIDEHLGRLGINYYLGIVASDISRDSLSEGRSGIYSGHQLRLLEPTRRDKYFTRLQDDQYQVVPELRNRVCFNQVNVLDMGKTPIGKMDVIMCQNLLIYYDQARRKKIVDTLVGYLAPGGMLILGVGEIIHWSHPEVERFAYANTLAYKRK